MISQLLSGGVGMTLLGLYIVGNFCICLCLDNQEFFSSVTVIVVLANYLITTIA